MLLQTRAAQFSIYNWVRDHRVHHKFSDTDADPHSINRGFFFSHLGWLCMKKHKDYEEKCKLIDLSDIEHDKVVMFQYKHYVWLYILIVLIIPTAIPILLWGETLNNAYHMSVILPHLFMLHITCCVNSFAHVYGNKPYDE
jgi:stearoyl-CoA desaturase (delta-9 desaturase)